MREALITFMLKYGRQWGIGVTERFEREISNEGTTL